MVFTEIELLLIHLPMSWWLWIILGFVILCMELFAPSGFFLFFIGLSGVLTGIVVATGVITQAWAEWVLCGAIIVGLLVSLRRPLMGKFYGPGKERASPVEGDEVIILE
ncbi:MAG: hypothetical protein DCC75_10375, partial [Proteobacteria bacterium]